MADLKIYNNGEGKILFSAGDRIIRQPYEFRNSFQNRAALSNYILVNNVELDFINSTELLWVNTGAATGGRVFTTLKATENNYSRVSWNDRGYFVRNNYPTSPSQNVLNNSIGVALNSINFLCRILRDSGIGTLIHNSMKVTSPISSQLQDTSYRAVILGAIIVSAGTSIVPDSYSTEKFNRYSIFSRALSDDEISYYYNNKLGSEFQSVSNLEIDLIPNRAEILDFSADQDNSDLRVGVRDYSGNNRHGQIMNLPVGTLQEQLDWANANLFVPFI